MTSNTSPVSFGGSLKDRNCRPPLVSASLHVAGLLHDVALERFTERFCNTSATCGACCRRCSERYHRQSSNICNTLRGNRRRCATLLPPPFARTRCMSVSHLERIAASVFGDVAAALREHGS